MEIGEREIVIASAAFAIIGIALLFFLSEAPQDASIAQASVSQENSLFILHGAVANATSDKFLLCDSVCISVRSNGLPSALLLYGGRNATVQGRVKSYMGKVYVEAERIEVD
ncbi:Uncharacterised protein [uncultured archaeon]|nr:Uncharacterised protein [uncultured archaeon]